MHLPIKLVRFFCAVLIALFSYLPVVSHASALSANTVSPWSTSNNPLPQGLVGPTSVTSNGYIYVMGGAINGADSSAVYSAPINANGSVGSWTTQANSLPQTEYYASSVSYNGYVYVIGGENNSNTSVATVYSAQLSSGTVGTWATSTNALPAAESGMAGSTYNGYVYIAGGQNASGTNVNTVYSAPLNSNGTVGTWATSTTSNSLPVAPYLLTSVAYNDYFYVLGGNISGSYGSGVYFANLSGAEYPVLANQTTSIAVNSTSTVNVLSGVSGDPDSATLQIVSGPSHGVAVDPPGTITYTPNKGYSGTDSLVYRVCSLDDESLCSQATLTFDISVASPDTGFGQPTSNLFNLEILSTASITLFGLGLLVKKYNTSTQKK